MSWRNELMDSDPKIRAAPRKPAVREAAGPVMSQDRLPLIGTSGRTAVIKHTHSGLQRLPQAMRKKHALPALTFTGHPDTMTPWGGLSLSESSFTSIPPPPPTLPAPLSPRTPHTPNMDIQVQSHTPSPPTVPLQDAEKVSRGRRRPLPPRYSSRLPPLRPITNLSFSRSFTFSFFELPLHQSPHCRADRIRHLTLLLRQIQY